MNKTCAAIIPFHNEKNRILGVLDIVTKVKKITKIICVDDGSSDNGYLVIQEKYPQVTLIRLPKNSGKSAAVASGLKIVNEGYVFLCDADLRFLKKDQVEKAVETIFAEKKIDMLILRRINSIVSTKLSRGDILCSGERILKTKNLKAIFKTHPKKYQLEIAINKYMLDNKKIVRWLPSSALSVFKINKVGLIRGEINEFKMLSSMFSYAGWGEYWRQLLSFCHIKYFSLKNLNQTFKQNLVKTFSKINQGKK